MLDWTLENLTAHDVARLRSIYEPLTESVRALIDATIRTEVGAEVVAAAKAETDAATAALTREELEKRTATEEYGIHRIDLYLVAAKLQTKIALALPLRAACSR